MAFTQLRMGLGKDRPCLRRVALAGLVLMLVPHLATALLNNLGMVAIHRGLASSFSEDSEVLWDAQEAPVCRDQGQCLRAAGPLSFAVQLGLADDRTWKNLGLVALVQRDLSAAGEALERVPLHSGQWRTARFLLGYRYEFDGDRTQAAAAWREAEAGLFFADGKPALKLLAPRPWSWDRALASAQVAADIDESLRGAMYRRIADLYTDLGRRSQADRRPTDSVAAYQRALDFVPSRMDVHISLAQIYRATGERDKAEAEYRQAVEGGNGVVQIQAYRELAQLYLDQQRLPEAVETLQTATAHYPENGDLGLLLGEALRRSGNVEAAEVVWRDAAHVPDPRQQTRAYEALGNLYQGQKRYAEAEAAVREAIARVPGITQYHLQLATVLQQQKRSDEAEAMLVQVLERGDARLRDAAAITLAQWQIEQQRPDRAISIYREAVQASPANGDLRLRLAGLLQRQGKLAEAEGEMRQATSNPDRRWQVEAYRALGGLYEQQKRWLDAVSAYDAGLALQPGDADLQQRRKRADDTARRPAG